MNIVPVRSRRELNEFVRLPYDLYRSDPGWVPPLRDEQLSQLDPVRNPFLQHCEWQLFLLKDGDQVLGRIAAFEDTLASEFWKERVGLFGYFECPRHEGAAQLLLETARDWLLARGCTRMRGPWTFVSQEWGMVVEGFTPAPVVMAPYNPPWYNEFLCRFGLEKEKDLLCWYVSAAEGYDVPRRILELTDAVAQRTGVHTRMLDMHDYEREVDRLMDVSNLSLIDNWGYSPVTEAEVRAMARDLRPVIQARGVIFAEDRQGKPVGFAITIPDVNTMLRGMNGSLLPFGWARLLWGLPRLRRYRMFALGVTPEYQGKGVDALIYRALYESLYSPQLWMEVNYVLEDNWPMINAINKLGAKPLRRYRIYGMRIEPALH